VAGINLTPEVDAYDRMSAAKFCGPADSVWHKKHKQEKKNRKELNKLLNPVPWAEQYDSYLKSRHWAKFRFRILKQRHFTCERCGQRGVTLHVHHLSYARFGRELEEDVIVVCVPCHQKRHMDKKTFWK
jgi:HNH endonuclease